MSEVNVRAPAFLPDTAAPADPRPLFPHEQAWQERQSQALAAGVSPRDIWAAECKAREAQHVPAIELELAEQAERRRLLTYTAGAAMVLSAAFITHRVLNGVQEAYAK